MWKVRKDGTAPEEAQNGDLIVTAGGTYKKGDPSYHVPKVTNDYYENTLNGKYENAGLNQPQPHTIPNAVKRSSTPGTDYSGALAMLMQESQKREGSGAYGGNEYDQKYRYAINRALGMNYTDWTQGDAYKALAGRYADQGRQAMDETIAQLAARTGGLASSYAGVAGQQQYNEYMKQLEDVARQMYAGERSDLIQNAELARDVGQDMYNRWLQEQSRRGDERNTQLQLLQQIAQNEQYIDERDYNRGRNDRADKLETASKLAEIGDYSGYADALNLTPEQQSEFEALYEAAQQASANETQRTVAEWAAKWGDFSGLDALGVDTTSAKQELMLKLQNLARQAAGTRSSGGSGGSGGSGSNPTSFDWTEIEEMAETKSDSYIENYLEINYKKLGFKSAAAAKAAWENHLEDIEGESDADENGEVGFNDVYSYAQQMVNAGATKEEVDAFLAKAKKRGLIGNKDGLTYGFDAYHYYGK